MYRAMVRVACFLVAISSVASPAHDGGFHQLDPKRYDPTTDSDIDMYISNWRDSVPRQSHGALIERDLLTKGDPLKPTRKGAVMTYFNKYCHATLAGRNKTAPVTLVGEQEFFYILSGVGQITGGGTTNALSKGIAVLVPVNLEFTITNTGDEPMTMLLISEPVPEGFRPNENIRVKDMNIAPITFSQVHWVMSGKDVFDQNDGMSTITSILLVEIGPMTMGQPHSHGDGFHEIWTCLEGDTAVLLGKQLRKQPPGTCYMIPPDGKTPHANINLSNSPVTFLHFRKKP